MKTFEKNTEPPGSTYRAETSEGKWLPLRIGRLAIAYPGGNPTALIFDEQPDVDRALLNRRVIAAGNGLLAGLGRNVAIEQCGFVSQSPGSKVGRLEMFGGEFCVNAARSAAYLLAENQGRVGLIEVSGTRSLLPYRVTGNEVAVDVPLPIGGLRARSVREGGVLIPLDGITHLVVANPPGNKAPRELLAELLELNRYGLWEQPAVGVTYYDTGSSEADFCVWVNEVGTMFDETACGSGTCAIGLATSLETGRDAAVAVKQPSGATLTTQIKYGPGAPTQASVSGPVEILYDGALDLS